MYSAMEDRAYHGVTCKAISELYLISEKLASKYACVMFLQHARLEIHPTHRVTGFLSWEDLLFFAAVLMVHWVPQRTQLPQLARGRGATGSASGSDGTAPSRVSPSHTSRTLELEPMTGLVSVVENGAEIGLRVSGDWPSLGFLQERLHPLSVRATYGLDLGTRLTNSLRDLKAHLINDAETLAAYRRTVMTRLEQLYSVPELRDLSGKLYLVVHGVRLVNGGWWWKGLEWILTVSGPISS